MEHPPIDFDTITEPIEARVAAGLGKVGAALRTEAWRGATVEGLTPTQGQALVLLQDEARGLRLTPISAALGISAATASDTLSALVKKGLVERGADPVDRRAAAFRLTPTGRDAAVRTAGWPEFLVEAVAALDPTERSALYGSLIKVIRSIQETGAISVQRMCVSCRYFQPNVRPDDAARPHVCGFVGAPFGDGHLRLDCREHETASPQDRDSLWRRYTAPPTPGRAPA